MGIFASGGRIFGARGALPAMLGFFGLLLLLTITLVLFMGSEMPRCNVPTMPCQIDELGAGLCSVMGADGTCWVRMQPVMKCFTRAISIKSGMCKGTFQTSLCAPSSQDVEEALFALGEAMTDLHTETEGTCNVTAVRVNQRCRLPKPRQETHDAVPTECCRAPLATCASDLDCSNCGAQSPACAPPIRCMVSVQTDNGTMETSTLCESTDDACLSFSYVGCNGVAGDASLGGTCDNGRLDEPFFRPLGVVIGDKTCCDDQYADDPVAALEARKNKVAAIYESEMGGECKCREKCQRSSSLFGCPCVDDKNGCNRKMCVRSAEFNKFGGAKAYLENKLGASFVSHCFTDNCNMRDDRGFT